MAEHIPKKQTAIQLADKRVVALDKDRITIGREEDNDVVIGNPTLSRYHAILERKEDGWYLTDLGSSNHTFVAGELLAPHEAIKLSVPVEVHFGEYSTTFRDVSKDQESEKSPRTAAETDVSVQLEGLFEDEVPAQPHPIDASHSPAAASSFESDTDSDRQAEEETYAILELRSISQPLRHEITATAVLLGSDPAQCDIVLRDATAPPVCAEIRFQPDGRISVRSQSSDAMLQVDGARVRRSFIRDQSIIDIGDSSFIFHVLKMPEVDSKVSGSSRRRVLLLAAAAVALLFVAGGSMLLMAPEHDDSPAPDAARRPAPQPTLEFGDLDEAVSAGYAEGIEFIDTTLQSEAMTPESRREFAGYRSALEALRAARDRTEYHGSIEQVRGLQRSGSRLLDIRRVAADADGLLETYENDRQSLWSSLEAQLDDRRWDEAQRTLDSLREYERSSDVRSELDKRLLQIKWKERAWNLWRERRDNVGLIAGGYNELAEECTRLLDDADSNAFDEDRVAVYRERLAALRAHARALESYWAANMEAFNVHHAAVNQYRDYPHDAHLVKHRDNLQELHARKAKLDQGIGEFRRATQEHRRFQPSEQYLSDIVQRRDSILQALNWMEKREPDRRFAWVAYYSGVRREVRETMDNIVQWYWQTLPHLEQREENSLTRMNILAERRRVSCNVLRTYGEQHFAVSGRPLTDRLGESGARVYREAKDVYDTSWADFTSLFVVPPESRSETLVNAALSAGDIFYNYTLEREKQAVQNALQDRSLRWARWSPPR